MEDAAFFGRTCTCGASQARSFVRLYYCSPLSKPPPPSAGVVFARATPCASGAGQSRLEHHPAPDPTTGPLYLYVLPVNQLDDDMLH